MPEAPDGTQVVVDSRSGFCFQYHDALDAIREHFDGAKRVTAFAVYLVLTETANRSGGAQARDGFAAARKEIADGIGISIDTLDRYIVEFESIGVVEVIRRKEGRTNLPNVWALTSVGTARVPRPGRTRAASPGRTGAAVKPSPKETLEAKEASPLGAPALVPYEEPPKVVKIDGRNLPLDLLVDASGFDPESPQIGQALTALNGSKGNPGIRHLFWLEMKRWAVAEGREVDLAAFYADPEKFTLALERGIRRKIEKYTQTMNGAMLTPTALRKWWLDVERQTTRRDGGMTSEEMRNFEDDA